MRKPFIVGNWKMNLDKAGAEALARGVVERTASVKNVNIGVSPAFPYLSSVKAALAGSPIHLVSQNIYFEAKGAFTGEVSAAMALDVGCGWTLLGHSERRLVIGENDAFINKKVKAALAAKLNVILCVGETLDQRQANKTEAVVESQLTGSLDGVNLDPATLVIAYEPVWAIGTGVVATPDQAEEVHRFIRQWLSTRYSPVVADKTIIQYGGSVNPGNAATLMAQPNVDGLLVGGASLKAEDFAAVVAAAQQ
ncbi:MAG: triose-phosphate isomerase [Gemmatales bacterium]